MDEIGRLIATATAAETAQKEKHQAFNALVKRFQDLAFGCAYAVLADFQLAEDAAQEAFLVAWRHLDQLRTPEAFPGWFKRIVLTQCNRLTRNKTLPTVPLETVVEVAGEGSDPVALLLQSETRGEIQAAICALPPHERMVVTLFYISDHSQNEIAAFLEVPVGTIKKRLFNARQRLRERMLAMVRETLQERRPSRDDQFINTVALFNSALESFVGKVKQDRNIIAVLLFGSLSYDEVWKKSDIDIILIGRNDRQTEREFCLLENGVNIHAVLYPRNRFKQAIEGTLQNSFLHTSFAKSTLLYTTDETIREYYENAECIGEKDRAMQLLRWGGALIYTLTKAEKWLCVKGDLAYSSLWILYCVEHLAKIETLLHSKMTSREAIQEAVRLNPELFRVVYTDFVHAPKTTANVQVALDRINLYLDTHLHTLFGPVLKYLSDAAGTRTTGEINTYFQKQAQMNSLGLVYEWLADKGVVQKVPCPIRLTEKSSAALVDEAAYYYDGENTR